MGTKFVGWIKADTEIFLKKPKKGKYLKLLVELVGNGTKFKKKQLFLLLISYRRKSSK